MAAPLPLPQLAQEAVLRPSQAALTTPAVRGFDFNGGRDMDRVLEAFATTGFQATALGNAMEVVNKMLDWTLDSEPVAEDEDDEFRDPEARQKVRCKVFLAYTSNLISAGTRETIRFLVEHKMVQVVVTSAGGVEEDFIKCLADTHLGSFDLAGATLRRQGINRIGNLLVPNSNYCKFEDWITPILHAMSDEQEAGTVWTPSMMIHRLGKEINDPTSVYYWCHKNNIPVFCPGLTDGSIGDMLYAHSYRRPGLILDIVGDIRRINDQALKARKTGVIILGGGVAKHHTLNANLMRNGADFTVFINTGQEFDGSDAGARPEEAISWGKVRVDTHPVKVHADATIAFPLLVGMTFARRFHAVLPVGATEDDIVFDKSYTPSEHNAERRKLVPDNTPDGSLVG
eukprot:GGOE01018082.1.p1 GENE.GGOE01018082.1~~GGOE01018082.1.p1  ORF type:complete len:420 (-),score=134.64 GGOE01018082.1:156-1355(-)